MDTKRKPFKSMSPVNMRRFEICILAGGLSSRMGRDKSRLRLGGRTLLAHVRATAKMIGLPHRIIRRDLVAHCGPLGGLYTALVTSRADATLFLSCDMPFVSAGLLEMLVRKARHNENALFVERTDWWVSLSFCFAARRCPSWKANWKKWRFHSSDWPKLSVHKPSDWPPGKRTSCST